MSKILLSLTIVTAVAVIAIGATGAYFSDTETSTGNTFTAGSLDLNIDGDNQNVVMFSVSKLIPGDSGTQEILLNNTGNLNGFLDVSFLNLVNNDVSCNDPEDDVDATCGTGQVGELADNLDIVCYIDENDNDVYDGGDELIFSNKALSIIGEKLSDYGFTAGASKVFRMEWSVDSGVGNIIQSDEAGFDVEFELSQTAGQ